MGEMITLSCPVLFLLSLILFSERIFVPAKTQESWCVAKPWVSDGSLRANQDYACGQVDCTQGGVCSFSNTFQQLASFAMNTYYQSKGRNKWDCNFTNTGLIAVSDPSYGSCIYEGGATHPLEGPQDSWCVAKPGTNNALLQSNIDFVCSRFNCSDIQNNGSCFYPNTLMNHASFAMNLWYRNVGKGDCDFVNSGLLVITDPSYHGCIYA